MTEYNYLSITAQYSRISSRIIDGEVAPSSADTLKSICIVAHPDASGSIADPLPAQYTDAPALESTLMARQGGGFDSNLLVSADIFTVLRTALLAGEKLRFKITDQANTFRCRIVLPLEEGDPVQGMSETVTRLDERIERIEDDVDRIREILQEIATRASSAEKRAPSSNNPILQRDDYTSIAGKGN